MNKFVVQDSIVFKTVGTLLIAILSLNVPGRAKTRILGRFAAFLPIALAAWLFALQPAQAQTDESMLEGPAANSEITASPISIEADNSSTSTITVRLLDVDGNYIEEGGSSVELSTDLGTLGMVDDPQFIGIYTAELTAGSTPGTAVISGTVDGEPLTATVEVEFTTPGLPTFSVARDGNNPTNATSLAFFVNFSESVANVDSTDFALSLVGTTATEIVVDNGGNSEASTYRVTVNNVSGTGSLGLVLASGHNIVDAAGNKPSANPSDGETYDVDNSAPSATAVEMKSDNAHGPTLGKKRDTVTLSFITDEDLTANTPVVKLFDVKGDELTSGDAMADPNTENGWLFTHSLAGSAANGELKFSIALEDEAGNEAIVTALVGDTDGGVVIDNEEPFLNDFWSSTNLTDPVPAGTVKVFIEFNEVMHKDTLPTLTFPTAGKDPTENDYPLKATTDDGWDDSYTLYTFNFVVVDALPSDFWMENIDIAVEDAKDAAGNEMDAMTVARFFDLFIQMEEEEEEDETLPAVSQIVVTPNSSSTLPYMVDPAPGDTVKIAVEFNEAMDKDTAPALTFPTTDEDPTENDYPLMATTDDGWDDAGEIYTFNFVVVDTLTSDFSMLNIDVRVASAKDAAENEMDAETVENAFDLVVEMEEEEEEEEEDETAPSLDPVSIASNNADPSRAVTGDQVVVTFQADEQLNNPDVTIAGVVATIASGTEEFEYTATVTVTEAMASGPVEFLIQYQDVVGNDGTDVAATTDGSRVTIGAAVEIQQEVIANFITNRMINILNNQPDITGFIDGSGGGSGGGLGRLGFAANEENFDFAFASSLGHIWERQRQAEQGNDGAEQNADAGFASIPAEETEGVYGLATDLTTLERQAYGLSPEQSAAAGATRILTEAQRRGYDIWTRINGAHAQSGDSKSNLWIGYLGTHVFLNPDLLIGGVVQLDWADETNDSQGSYVDGFGWMVGPYIAAKMPHHNLYFDARAAWGRSDNTMELDAFGSQDDFETERWLFSAKLSGKIETASFWTIMPSISASYLEETQLGFTNQFSEFIDEQTFSIGEVRFGPTFEYEFLNVDGMVIRPHFGVDGVWNFGIQAGADSSLNTFGTEQIRARFDAGLAIKGPRDWALDFAGFYDGLGIENYEAWGGSVDLRIPLP